MGTKNTQKTDGDPYMIYQVTVKNVGLDKIDFAEVTVNFYAARGTLIDTSKDAVMSLKMGERWTFTIACSGADCDRVTTYDVEALAGTSSGIR